MFTIGREPLLRLRDSFTPLAAAVILYTGVCLFSGLWSHFGAYAANESSKQIMALALFLLVLARFPKARLRRLFQAVSAVLSAVSLLCIDGASLKLLTRGFIWVMNRLGTGYLAEEMGYESGIRITGIYNNPNIAAGMIAFGLLVSLFLYRTARSERARGAAQHHIAIGRHHLHPYILHPRPAHHLHRHPFKYVFLLRSHQHHPGQTMESLKA